jgi:hypothetical protein
MSQISVQQIDAWRSAKSETEHLEFKEAKNQFSFDDLLCYCVAIGNEGGGHLLLGISDKPPRHVVGTSAYPSVGKVAEQLLNKLHLRVDIEEVNHPDGRVLVFDIPPRPFRHPLEVDGTYYMRSGGSLVAMTPDQLKKIFNERSSGQRLGGVVSISLVLVALGSIGYIFWTRTHPPRLHDQDQSVREDHVASGPVTSVTKPEKPKPEETGLTAGKPNSPHAKATIIPRKRSAEGKLNQPAPTQAEPTAPTEKQQPPVFIETAPTFGNLGDRAIALSDEIMQDLYWHGWKNWGNRSGQQTLPVQQMPTKPEEIQAWTRSRSSYFRFRFAERVLDIRNEFAQLHLRDERLDDFFKFQGMIEQANRQMAAASPGREIDAPILPQQIEEVAERLKVLANQIPIQRAAPKALHFSVTKVQPEKPEFSFEIVATIDTDTDISAGYIAVEFDGARAFTATDFADSKLVFLNDGNIIGNKLLKEYLSAHLSDSYIIAVGKTPLTTKKPIHVVAGGASPFNVTKVTLFEK